MTGHGTYRLGRELGRGALGRVVEVDAPDGARLAGKILHDSHRADDKALARFAAEAEITRDLNHPNIAKIYGMQTIDGNDVMLMELVEGQSLAHLIASASPLPPPQLLTIGAALAGGLAAAHLAGLIHRDLKPDNILLTVDGSPKIVDFGLARATSFAGVDAGAFAVVGTPDYMAPEAIDPLALDARSDLYGLGCILFEMKTGAPPFRGATAFAVIEAHRQQPIPTFVDDPEGLAPLSILIRSLLAKSPADRPQSASAVRKELETIRDTGQALTLSTANALAITGSCASCGAIAIPEVGVCFGCGIKQAQLERGKYTVFVTGPGETSDKLDSGLRAKLAEWIRANPWIGLAVGPLAKTVPRLPFVIANRVSEPSANALVGTLASLGLEARSLRGGRFALKAIRQKGWKLGGRIAFISLGTMIYGFHRALGATILPFITVVGAASIVGGFVTAGKHAALQSGRLRSVLPPVVATPLLRAADIVPTIAEARHRDSLRAIVQRAMALRPSCPATERDALDRDLGTLLDLSLIGVSRVDQIDAELGARDLRNPSPEDRQLMRERDSWSTRLLEITAFLDSLRARYAAVQAPGASTAGPSLEDLRAHIEALEEIQAL